MSGSADLATASDHVKHLRQRDLGVVGKLKQLRFCAIAPSSSTQLAAVQRSDRDALNKRFSVRARNGGKFSHVDLLQLSLQTTQQVSMNTGIDFLAENLLGTLDRQCGHLLTQASRALIVC
jgi:hypothetical protein